MGRKSLAEVEARRADVYQMLMQGKPKHHILSYCLSNWGVRLSAVEHDIAAVRKELKEEFQKQKEEIVASHVARYENLYRFYMDEGSEEEPNIHFNPETASKMLEKKERLLNLHTPNVHVENQQIIANQNNLNLEHISLEDLQRLLSSS